MVKGLRSVTDFLISFLGQKNKALLKRQSLESRRPGQRPNWNNCHYSERGPCWNHFHYNTVKGGIAGIAVIGVKGCRT